MPDSIPLLIPWLTFHLALMAGLLCLLRSPRPTAAETAVPLLVRTRVGVPPQRPRRRPEVPPLDGGVSPLVRPYVVAAEQAARRYELLLAEFGLDGPGPYVIHGVEVA
ncbi:hypothetical protein AB0M32_39060 [Streptomyces sp. NPDC051985]|uniref:hypothetical protein n=1 Tax=Streptomyces sp. NPDC051985 TaxID=3155807 RepID=UPI003416B2C8